jgi:hypothetical protein
VLFPAGRLPSDIRRPGHKEGAESPCRCSYACLSNLSLLHLTLSVRRWTWRVPVTPHRDRGDSLLVFVIERALLLLANHGDRDAGGWSRRWLMLVSPTYFSFQSVP